MAVSGLSARGPKTVKLLHWYAGPMRRTAEIPPTVQQAMNEQVKNELASAYQYLAMAAYLESTSFPGAARWMREQAQEELMHAMRFYDFIADRNGRVTLQTIEAPRAQFSSILECFEAALENEQRVTSDIIGLHELAVTQKDYVSHSFIQEFLTEQVEEEKNASRIVDMLRMAGTQGHALLMVDQQLAQRQGAQ